MLEIAGRANDHWNRRMGIRDAEIDELDDFSYVSGPSIRKFRVKTRYVYQGRGTPQPFDLSDEQ